MYYLSDDPQFDDPEALWEAIKNNPLQFIGLYDETIEGLACTDESSIVRGPTLRMLKVVKVKRFGVKIVALEAKSRMLEPVLRSVEVILSPRPKKIMLIALLVILKHFGFIKLLVYPTIRVASS